MFIAHQHLPYNRSLAIAFRLADQPRSTMDDRARAALAYLVTRATRQYDRLGDSCIWAALRTAFPHGVAPEMSP